jgi:stage II sporulation protein D
MPLGLVLPFLLLSCSSNSPSPNTHKGVGDAKTYENPAMQNRVDKAEEDTFSYEGAPYPDARDTLSWDLSKMDLGGDSAQGWTSPPVPPLAQKLPPVSRPDGLRQRPRPKDLPDKIHVLLVKDARVLSLYSLGEMQILTEGVTVDPKTNEKSVSVSRLATLRGRFTIKHSGTGFEVTQGAKTIQSTPSRRLRMISLNPYNLVDLGGTVYRGGLHIIAGSGGGITAVNVLGVEDYLRGVLPYELGTVDREALEALKALAVVARTYAYRRMLHPNNGDFHVYSDVQDQVYKGVKGEYLLSDRAVWETRGVAVVYGDSMAQCYYFSTCGGRTASKHEVWGGDSIPYLVSRPDTDAVGDAYCQSSKYSTWNEEWTLPQLAGIVKKNLKAAGAADAPSFSAIKNVEVASRASCGRIRTLRITTDRGPIIIKGDKVRWAMKPSGSSDKILPSAWFDVKVAGGKVTAQGRAFGHGVGLCQVGAIGRARANQNYKQIIDAYYTGVQVVEFK